MSDRKLPDTSIEAHKLSHELASAHKAKIIAALQQLEFAHYEMIADFTGLEKHAVGRRLSELEADQKIFKSGVKKKTSSDRDAYCYCLTYKAVAQAKVSERKRKAKDHPKHIQQTLL